MVETGEVDKIVPSGMIRQNKQMQMLRATEGMRDGSDVYLGEMSEEDGGAGIPSSCERTDVQAAYQEMLEAIGNVCSVYDVGFKDVLCIHEDNTGAYFLGTVYLFRADPPYNFRADNTRSYSDYDAEQQSSRKWTTH